MESSQSGHWQDGNIIKPYPEQIVWVPCIPHYASGTLIPLYNLSNFPANMKCPSETPKISRGGIKSKPWTHEEDTKLGELVSEFGLKQWSTIARALNTIHNNQKVRKGKHCRERWYNHLNPDINKGEWSYEEDILLLAQQKLHGNKWSAIARMLKGRTENAVKNRWNSLVKNFKQDMNLNYMANEAVADILIKELSGCLTKTDEKP